VILLEFNLDDNIGYWSSFWVRFWTCLVNNGTPLSCLTCELNFDTFEWFETLETLETLECADIGFNSFNVDCKLVLSSFVVSYLTES